MSASKKDELVEKALKVFYREGFHATGMDKLVAETKISKTSMYKHFRSKEDLILATLKLRDERFRSAFVKRTEELATDPEGQLLATFDTLGEGFQETDFQSCMFIKASSEYQEAAHPIHKESADHKHILRNYLEDLAQKANLQNPSALATQLQLLQEGAIVLAHLHGGNSAAIEAKAAAEALIKAAEV